MKDLKSYIESGVLELYVLGQLSLDEAREVDELAVKHPKIKAELEQIENALEAYAAAQAMEPDASIRERILSQFPTESTLPQEISSEPFQPLQGTLVSPFYKYAFAASVALLLLSLVSIFRLNQELFSSRNQIASLESSQRQFSSKVNLITDELSKRDQAIQVLKDPQFRKVKMAGTKQIPEAQMSIAYHAEKQEVWLDMSNSGMPQNDQDHQYQLWAIVDGVPVDLGVFDLTNEADPMLQMKSVEKPQAFAVTLEKRGGSAEPTMEQLMVIGNVG